jgi:hypothetical protein
MADDPLLDDKIAPIDKGDIPTRRVGQAVLDRVIPALNRAVGHQKRLHERVLQLEEEVVDGDARSAGDNPILAVPPLDEALTPGTVENLLEADVNVQTGADLCRLTNEEIRAVGGIGEATLDDIRDHYPKLDA